MFLISKSYDYFFSVICYFFFCMQYQFSFSGNWLVVLLFFLTESLLPGLYWCFLFSVDWIWPFFTLIILIRDPGRVVHSYLIIGLKSWWGALCMSMDIGVCHLVNFTPVMGWDVALGEKPNIRMWHSFLWDCSDYREKNLPISSPGKGGDEWGLCAYLVAGVLHAACMLSTSVVSDCLWPYGL